MLLEIFFWLSVFMIFYIYFGYMIVLRILLFIKRLFIVKKNLELPVELPKVTLLIAAYNELDFIDEKVKNTRELDYPKDKLEVIWVTDGSDDGTPQKLRSFTDVTVLHEDARNGKINAINRAMKFVNTDYVIFCDANTYLSPNTCKEIVICFTDSKTGCVAGEKSIFQESKDAAASAGEGMYWKIESKVKTYESEISSVCGAAGELFAIRTNLFEPVEKDTILDDFIISMRIAKQGYKVKYAPKAVAQEHASLNVKEEQKRKIRIASGGIQSAVRLAGLLNFFRYPWLSFSFLSHKALRWTILPLAFIACLALNVAIVAIDYSYVYCSLLLGQIFFYLATFLGWFLEKKSLRFKLLFAPYYMNMINVSIILGTIRFIRGNQSVNWSRSKRKQS